MGNFIKSTLLVITFLAISWLLPSQALSLSCANAILPPADRFEKSEYVFVGRVVGASDDPAKVAISKTYKGDLPEEVSVMLSSMWDSFALKPGSEYLFLLDSYESSTKTASRSKCNYNAAVDTSSADFAPYRIILDTNAKNPYTVFIFIGIGLLIVTTIGYKVLRKTKKK